MKKQKNKCRTSLELQKTIRNTWGQVIPITRIEKDKTKYNRKKKHKKRYDED